MQYPIHTIKHPINATLTLPGSEIIAYHALLLASLSNGVSEITGIPTNENITTFINALTQLGIAIQQNLSNHSCIIAGGNGHFPKKQATAWCADSTASSHFLLSACAVTAGVYYFDGSIHLRDKPLSPLLDILCRQGAQPIPPDAHKMPFTLIGSESSEGGEIMLDNKLPASAISALMITAPFARTPVNFTLIDPSNQPFVDSTCAIMAEFGVLICHIHQGKFMVPVPQRYQANDYVIEPDLSLAVYFLAATAVIGGEMTIIGAKHSASLQPDGKFISILEKMGCRTTESSTGLTLKSTGKLQGLDVNLRHFSDTFLALAAIAPFSSSPIRITHIGHLSHHETIRMNAVKTEWQNMGIHVETGNNWIKIYPGTPHGQMINAIPDRRLAMACCIMGLKTPGMVINNAESIVSVCADYFSYWESLTDSTHSKA